MSQESPSVIPDGVIARSRSRYRGNRSNQNVTSPQSPPKIRPDLLEQQKFGPQYAQETRGLNASTNLDKIRAAPSKTREGVTEDEYNYSSTPPANSRPPVVPSASLNQRSRTFPEETQMTQRDSQTRKVSAGTTRMGQPSVEEQIRQGRKGSDGNGSRGHEASRQPIAGHRVSRREHVKPMEAFEKSGKQQMEESQGRSNAHPFKSPPLPHSSTFGEQKLSHVKSAPVSSKPSTLQKRSLAHRRKDSDVRDELKRSISAPMAVDPAEISNKPAFDAPVSAVNAGDRKVRVQFDQTLLSIAVTPSTTPLDILSEAGSQLSMPMDPTMNVLMECFKQLGLERPLRRYERIRDIMNSWDNDSQNSLSILPSPTGGRDTDLDLSSVASNQPGDTSVHIYHSNSPSSWDKRWITLRSDGQVLMSKKADGKENLNICHLSDFDIYVPTKRQLAKKIKPPKKYCFAVKSQQKSAMFLTTENFVHFFAAGDKELGLAWYKAVQEWRSWYLVNVMGEGQKTSDTSSSPQRPLQGHQAGVSTPGVTSVIDHAHQQQTIVRTQMQPTSRSIAPKPPPTHNHAKLPATLPKKLSKDATSGAPTTRNDAHYRASIIQHQPLVALEPEPFAAQGLLGRSYTQRQKTVASGPSSHVAGHVPAPGDHGLQRRSTQRPTQQPLLDLTPKHQEPLQHRKKGTSFNPEQFPLGGLVEAATNTDPTVTNPLELRGAGIRKPSLGRNPHPTGAQSTVSPERYGPAFTGGLLSSVQKQGQDGGGTGHGVKTGDRSATEPLLDMTIEGPWAKGSLLDRVNSGESGSGPPVDREKRREMDAPVGEGL